MTTFTHEARWTPEGRLRRAQIPADIRPWLLDRGSLTQRIIEACDGDFRVEVRQQSWQHPLLSEQRMLHLRKGSDALIREVNLLCSEQRWVYARTVFPRHTLVGELRQLAHLGSRSLGAFLFSRPDMVRLRMEVAPLTERDELYQQALLGCDTRPQSIWGRRSLFCLHDKPVLVYEMFIPVITGGRA